MDLSLEVKKLNIELTKEQSDKFEIYYNYLVDYNEKVNLTAITKYEEVMIKHFYDSLTLCLALDNKPLNLCDVGAGAGFPSVPVAIYRNDVNVTIIDALNKRINFLNELVNKLEINNVKAIHSRAEDFAISNRETFDVCTARAVARLNVLAELCMPLVKVGGYFVAMKSLEADEELDEATKAIEVLGGKVERIQKIELPYESGSRQIIIIKKERKCPSKYPRQFSVIKNKPIR